MRGIVAGMYGVVRLSVAGIRGFVEALTGIRTAKDGRGVQGLPGVDPELVQLLTEAQKAAPAFDLLLRSSYHGPVVDKLQQGPIRYVPRAIVWVAGNKWDEFGVFPEAAGAFDLCMRTPDGADAVDWDFGGTALLKRFLMAARRDINEFRIDQGQEPRVYKLEELPEYRAS